VNQSFFAAIAETRLQLGQESCSRYFAIWSSSTISSKAGEITDPSCYSFARFPAYIPLITSTRRRANSTPSSSIVRVLTDFLGCRDHTIHQVATAFEGHNHT